MLDKPIDQFMGIPFAEPPVGQLRFSKPVAIREPSKKIIDATIVKNSCLQNDGTHILLVNEDCLFLNIWAPNQASNDSVANKPLKKVMFWIYGGSLTSGSIFLPVYYGEALAAHDVVVVTTNYRLGAFGFLYGGDGSAPGDVGFHDQLMALQWTRDNIERFGGDPNEITIFGESAGSWSVSAHVLSPLSKGLFKRAILESGAIFMDKDEEVLSKDKALKEAKLMASKLNCTDDKQWLQCLRKVDAQAILMYSSLDIFPMYGTEYLPISAQQAFKTGNYNTEIDIMAGVMHDEGSLLAHHLYPQSDKLRNQQDFSDMIKQVTLIPGLDPKKLTSFYLAGVDTNVTGAVTHAFWQLFGDHVITCPTYLFAKQFAQHTPKRNVMFYQWTYYSESYSSLFGCTKEMGVCHAMDIPFVFGLPVIMHGEEQAFSEQVMKMWTNFAKNGNPMEGTGHQWPRLIQTTGAADGVDPVSKIKEINPTKDDHIIENLFAKTCDGFLRSYFLNE
ncbi:cholinesterase 1-like [Oppia nitens]|uniref:cholinesterase 1-like n=1 Tax=Oppia nitens TaxID=1686743 RepID=UPI0023DB9DDD|nr:cholinesterase 1-like [Oppia nitens]